jgi:vacuolar-type H+-ATPase subunit H
MPVDRQVEALLALVDADRARKCDAILGEARERAGALLREAHEEARNRMRQMFAEERERRARRVASANARLQTRRRVAEQQRAAAYIAAAWQRMPAELLRRWRSEDARTAWVAHAVAAARAVLPRVAWRIAHDPGWPAEERERLTQELVRTIGAAPRFVSDERIRAGLKIAVEGNVVDGTLEGLLAERSEIGSRLLREIERDAAS